MNRLICTLLALGIVHAATAQESEEWITILIHGTVAFQSNASLQNVVLIKQDRIEGTKYERNVLQVRKNEYLFTVQAIQEIGLHRVKKKPGFLNAAYAFSTLYADVQNLCGIKEKNTFYTFGWSGLISMKRRYAEARSLYQEIKKLLKKKGKKTKIRLIGYSHGATMLLNCADVRCKEYPQDTFQFDEVFLVGIPVQKVASRQVKSPLFKQVYSIYSHGDKVQRLDVFTPYDLISHRTFKGCQANLTQIDMRISAPLRPNPCYCLPSNMQGTINQSPGHIELWFFGWIPSSYRQNLNMYPLPAAVFIPYLVCAAKKLPCNHIQVDIWPEEEFAYLRSHLKDCCAEIPFFTNEQYVGLIDKGLEWHPSRPEYKKSFDKLLNSVDKNAYQ